MGFDKGFLFFRNNALCVRKLKCNVKYCVGMFKKCVACVNKVWNAKGLLNGKV